jgi:hypothetical protein
VRVVHGAKARGSVMRFVVPELAEPVSVHDATMQSGSYGI